MLGHVVECVSKQPLGAYFQQHIFTPLGMSSTGFTVKPVGGVFLI
jgi:CubicO group peptidase (beta-lactamase class C family)